MVQLFPALRDRENHAIFTHRKQGAPWTARHLLAKKAGEFYEVKLVGKNCMDAISTRFPGFRLSPPLPMATRLRGPFQSGLGSIGFRFYLLFYRNRP